MVVQAQMIRTRNIAVRNPEPAYPAATMSTVSGGRGGAVAVTGATGFIGSAVVRQLLAQGRTVRALVEPGANGANLEGLNVERIACDVNDAPRLKVALSGCEALYHLAAIYKTWLPDPEIIYRVNVEGTASVLLAATEAKIPRIVYTSSIAAIGVGEDGAEADETTRFNLFDVAMPYILTKWQSERIAMRFAAGGAPVVVVNPAFPFGPRDVAPTPTGGIIKSLLDGKMPGVSAGGFCAIDVDDCAAGHLLAEEMGRVGERYILGNHNVTWKQLFEAVGRVAGVPVPTRMLPRGVSATLAAGMEWWSDHVSHAEPLATYKSVRYAQKSAFFSNAKARRELGLPTRPLDVTLRRAVDWFRDHDGARA